MNIKEYVQQFPDVVFELNYFFNYNCPECHKNFDSLDEEYSFCFTASDVGTTGYDWIFDDFNVDSSNVDIVDNVITITVYSDEPVCCPDCYSELYGD